MEFELIIKILGNIVPILFGVYAIRLWKKGGSTKIHIFKKLGLTPFSIFHFLLGLFLGGLLFTVIFLIFKNNHLLEINNFTWVKKRIILTTFSILTLAIGEEIIFRSFFITGLKQLSKSTLTALIVSSLFFSMVHLFNEGSTLLSSISSFIGGLMYGIAFIKSKKIWLPIGLHFSWNYFQGFIFGFPLSGYVKNSLFDITITGSELWTGNEYGPEGGLIGIFARIIIIILILFFTSIMRKSQ